MLFNSYEFIFIFLPAIFFGYFFLLSKRLVYGSKLWIVGGSLFFYSWWNPIYLPLILTSIVINYLLGRKLGVIHGWNDKRKKLLFSEKVLLNGGVIFNLVLLGYFKYADFFIGNINGILESKISLIYIALPLAISFFTFQQIAYLIDSYRGETKEYDFVNYMLFVTFFPQLVAGPIVHHREMMPQFSSRWNLVKRYRNIATGLFIFTIGLFKKVVFADTFSKWASSGFDTANTLDFFEAWATSLSYTFQIYFDFSGYTDMAIGIGLLFNIVLPTNFNSPYKAKNIQDFWHRWHITLSRFLRDYIYIPLGGNRKSDTRTCTNLFVTFLLGGLWHGASWMFVFWGVIHGTAIVIHRIWQRSGMVMSNWLALIITFNFINITWVVFRSQDIYVVIKVLVGMTGLGGFVVPSVLQNKLFFSSDLGFKFGGFLYNINGDVLTPLYIITAFVFVLVFKNSQEITRNMKATFFDLWFAVTAFFLAFVNLGMPSDFLYFNF